MATTLVKDPVQNLERLAYTTTEVCELIHISKPTLYKWVKDKNLPFINVGGRKIIIPADVLKEWLTKQALDKKQL